MFGQERAGLLHAVDNARRELQLLEIIGHGLRQLAPEFIAYNGKLMGTRCDENQDAFPVARFVHAQVQVFPLTPNTFRRTLASKEQSEVKTDDIISYEQLVHAEGKI